MDDEEIEVEGLERRLTNRSTEPIQISYSVIKSITKNFCQPIGHGASGVVYLGALRNNVMVAVKKICTAHDFSDTQFLKEAKCLNRVNHKNIVRFLGYCADTHGVFMKVNGEERLVEEPKRFLCFEYVSNGTLHYYLQEKTYGYEWSIQYKILRGICQGLQYLHQQRITHLDLKPENVLLGAQMEPKITDFGLSRCNDGTQSTIFTTNLQGTPGYIPPELIDEGKISFKSDIYSLGIIMMRILTGSNADIPEHWCELLNVNCQQMETCVEIAKRCASKDPVMRPTISEIICKLTETETMTQNVSPVSTFEPTNDPNSRLYQNVKRFLSWAPESQEYNRGGKRLRLDRPKWRLEFHRPPNLPIIAGMTIQDTYGKPLEVILVDVDTGEPSAFPNLLRIELVPLLGNFPQDRWDADDFQKGIVGDLEGNRPLLAGDCRLTMWDGQATVNELMFTDDSIMCGCMFRIGVHVVSRSYRGPRILEAMTDAFFVRRVRHSNEHNRWKLAFQSQPQLPIYVGQEITDIIGNPLEVILVDTETGSPSATRTKLHIQLVPLSGNFPGDGLGKDLTYDGKHWTEEEFSAAIVKPRKEDVPLLKGDVSLIMRDGRVTVNKLQFMDDTSWVNWKVFRIGVCLLPGIYDDGPCRIVEGMTKAFPVKYEDSRNEMNTKSLRPCLGDEVWRLQEISWGGVFHKRLTQNNVTKVQDFLRMLAVKPDQLRTIMGDGMEDSTWKQITHHARCCASPIDRLYAYSAAGATIYMNSIFDLAKVEFGGKEYPLQEMDEAQKRLVKQVMQDAYEQPLRSLEVKLTLKLAFKSKPQLPIYTGRMIQDATGNPLEIILVDAKTGSPWALQMALHIQLVPLLGFRQNHRTQWSAQDFEMAIVKWRLPLLQGHDVMTCMWNGRATVRQLYFADEWFGVGSGWLRIGARVVPSSKYDAGALRILEAITQNFKVRKLKQ